MTLKITLDDLMQRECDMKNIAIDQIVAGSKQVRKVFDAHEELTASVKNHGVLEPLLLKPLSGNKFAIICGERRWRAATSAGLTHVPARIMNVSEKDMLTIGIVENVQRSSLSAVEEANAYKAMLEEGFTQEQVAEAVCKSRVHVTNTLRLLQLPDEVQRLVQERKLKPTQARALLGMRNIQEKTREVLQKRVTVRDLEQSKKPNAKKEDIALIESELSTLVGMQVEIRAAKSGGAIVMKYSDWKEIDAFMEKLTSW